MEQKTRARHGPRDRGRVAHISFHDLDVETGEICSLAGWPQQGADGIAGADQGMRDGGPDEARSSRDQNLVLCHSAGAALESLQFLYPHLRVGISLNLLVSAIRLLLRIIQICVAGLLID